MHLFWPKLPLASWTVTGAWCTGCNSYAQNCMNNLNSGLFLLVPGCSDVWPISDRLQEEGTRWVERCWRTWPRCVWRGSPNSAVWRMFGEPKAAVFDEIIPVWHLRGSSYPCWASAVLSPDRAQHTRLPPMLATCELQGTGQGCLGSLLAALGTSTPGVSRQMLQFCLLTHCDKQRLQGCAAPSLSHCFPSPKTLQAASLSPLWINGCWLSPSVGWRPTLMCQVCPGKGILGSMEYFLLTCKIL